MRYLPALLWLATAVASTSGAEVDYLQDVKPLLAKKCVGCHGPVRQEAGLRLDAASLIQAGSDSGQIVLPGKPEASPLIARVISTEEYERMPPPEEGEALTPKQVAVLRTWIHNGMPAPADEEIIERPEDHWAYQPIKRPEVPTLADAPGANPIDAFVRTLQQRQGLRPLPQADRATLLRRLSLDLIGLPPTVAELEAFLADDSPAAIENAVTRLLSSPQYGERWGRHWMDVWRYSDWDGYKNDLRGSQRHIWHWRDWIVESLNADKGYDDMIVEMLAGDEIAPDDPDTLRATGFLARSFHGSNRNIWLDATVEHTAKAFLGMTLNCARCHDHKFDPLAQADYYRFRAIFEPHRVRTERLPGQPDLSKNGLPRIYDADLDVETYLYVRGNEKQPDKEHPLDPAVPGLFSATLNIEPVPLPPIAYFPALAEHYEREDLAAAEKRLHTAQESLKKVLANSSEITETELVSFSTESPAQRPPAPALPQTVSREEQRARLQWNAARLQLDALKARWAADKARAQPKSDQQPRELEALARRAAQLERQSTLATAVRDQFSAWEKFHAAKSSNPEDAAKRGQAIEKAQKALTDSHKKVRTAQADLAKTDSQYSPVGKSYPRTSTGRRLALARWITSAKNPLAARVAVNQIWMRHFGQPLVENVFDFGLRSPHPVQAKLLDWLAAEFIAQDWSMKHIHRLITTSRTWQQASSGDSELMAHNVAIDPENHYFWRAEVQRLDAEVIRDSVMAIAKQLDTRQGGPEIDYTLGESVYRRSMYFRHAYEKQMKMLVLFDAPNPDDCYRRSESIVPQQALVMANSQLTRTMSRVIAERLNRQSAAATSPESAFVSSAFLTILSRQPTPREVNVCQSFLAKQTATLAHPEKLSSIAPPDQGTRPASGDAAQRARESLVHVLINHNDFVSLR